MHIYIYVCISRAYLIAFEGVVMAKAAPVKDAAIEASCCYYCKGQGRPERCVEALSWIVANTCGRP